jgi:CheY-like chemotaxis protein
VTDKGQVLVVDDNPGIRRLLGRLLHSHRFSVLEASSVPEAVSTVGQHAISAVILDLHLGTQSGLDLLERLRQDPRHAETPVLILTGTNSMSDEAETTIRRNGAQLFHKPISLGLLVEHIERMTGARQPVAVA